MVKLGFKGIFLIIFLIIETLVFGWIYFFGEHGISQLKLAKIENELFAQEVYELQKNVEKLENQFQVWQNDDFYKEKMARERLHMSKAGEQIYNL